MPVDINDPKTQKIIESLIRHPRITSSALAKLVGLSRAKCGERIEEILKDGYLQLRPNISLAKYQFYAFIYIKLKNTHGNTLTSFEQIILNCRSILACYHITGEYDYIVVVGAESHREFVRIFSDLQIIECWESIGNINRNTDNQTL